MTLCGLSKGYPFSSMILINTWTPGRQKIGSIK